MMIIGAKAIAPFADWFDLKFHIIFLVQTAKYQRSHHFAPKIEV